MAENVTLLALTQLADLSLNCRDGIINFQALHTLLQVMIQKLDLSEIGIEFRGPDSDHIQTLLSTMKPQTRLYPEYTMTGESKSEKKKSGKVTPKKISLQDIVKKRDRHEVSKEKELRVIDRRKDSKEDPDIHPLPLKSPTGSLMAVTPGDLQTIVVVESRSNLPQTSIALTKSTFDELVENMNTLKEQIKELTELPSNAGILSVARQPSAPILDMFQILSLSKRMEANEIAMTKMTTLIEDLAKLEPGTSTIMQKVADLKESVDSAVPATEKIRKASISSSLDLRITKLENSLKEVNQNMETLAETVAETGKDVGSIRTDTASTGKPQDTASVSKQTKNGPVPVFAPIALYDSVVQDVALTDVSASEAFAIIQQEFENLKKWVTDSIQIIEKRDDGSKIVDIDNTAIDAKFKEYQKQLEQMNKNYNIKISQINDQFKGVQQDMNDVFNKLEIVLPGGDSTGINAEITMELANKLSILENDIASIAEKAEKLQEEKEEHDRQTAAILEQIDLLKIVKANREDLEDALGEKADACMINRKVSHDQFDAACDDLTKGIEEALARLKEQEEMWHQALDTIQRQVGNKLDKMEVDPLRDYVNGKLKALQEKFKSLTAFKKEQDAAGTKSKLLRNVNCISCDKDVTMRKEIDVESKPKPYAMPPSRNMAPYLAYELDQLRKQQKCVPGSKNLNFIETALKTRGAFGKDHVCNRYCGGSHTVTTPQQRVTRLGHFLEQWGPEIAPLQDEYVRGKDNQMYKARDENIQKKSQKTGAQGKSLPNQMSITESKTPQQTALINTVAQNLIENEQVDPTEKRPPNIGSLVTNNQYPEADSKTEED